MNEEQIKLKVQRRIVLISGLILIGKFIAYFLTNSVGVLTDAMESIVNVVAGLISLYCLSWGAKPGDKEHPYGHGKIELISASVEGILISVAGCMIIYEAIKRLVVPAEVEKPKCSNCIFSTCKHRKAPMSNQQKITLSNFILNENEINAR